MKIIPRAIILTIFLLLTTACAGNETVTIEDAWARPGSSGDNSAVYFKISNITGFEEVLIGAQCDVAAAAEIHLSTMDNAGTMTMEHQEEVRIHANSQVEFKPGDLHVMLVNLMRDLSVGETFPLTLEFKRAGDITLEVMVKQP